MKLTAEDGPERLPGRQSARQRELEQHEHGDADQRDEDPSLHAGLAVNMAKSSALPSAPPMAKERSLPRDVGMPNSAAVR